MPLQRANLFQDVLFRGSAILRFVKTIRNLERGDVYSDGHRNDTMLSYTHILYGCRDTNSLRHAIFIVRNKLRLSSATACVVSDDIVPADFKVSYWETQAGRARDFYLLMVTVMESLLTHIIADMNEALATPPPTRWLRMTFLDARYNG